MRKRVGGRILHILTDGLLLILAALLAYFIRVGFIFSSDVPFFPFLISALFGTAGALLFLLAGGYYRLHRQSGAWLWVLRIIASISTAGLLAIAYYFLANGVFSRGLTLLVAGFSFCFFIITNSVFSNWLKRQVPNNATLIIGANRLSESIAAALGNDIYSDNVVVGCLDPYGISSSLSGLSVLGKLNKLHAVCDTHSVKTIIQCDAYEHTANIHAFCAEEQIEYFFLPAIRGVLETPQFKPISEKVGIMQFPSGEAKIIRFLRRQVFGT